MGIFDRLRSTERIARSAELLPAPRTSPRTAYAYTTPFRSGEPQLVRTIVADVLTGQQAGDLTREMALQLPAVANGRAQIISRLASRPLRDFDTSGLTKVQPSWLYRTNGALGPWQRMARTLDDLIFYGESLWLTERGEEKDGRRPVLDAIQWPRELWQLHPDDRRIQLRATYTSDDWVDADSEQVLYIPGPFDGLLKSARKTIEGGLALERSWIDAANTPVPAIILREKEENGMAGGPEGDGDDESIDEVGEVIRQVAEARRDPNGRVMFVPWWIDAEVVGAQAAELLIEGRNAVKLDLASHLGLPASAVDAALPKASLNYETQEGNAAQLHDRLDYWTAPIEEALSGDLMTPRGRRVRFDFADSQAASGPTTED